jgi:hypothetical protein
MRNSVAKIILDLAVTDEQAQSGSDRQISNNSVTTASLIAARRH